MKAIVTHDLCKSFKDVKAVKNLNLEVAEGEVYALLGSNGAGKTTTIKMLTCLIFPTSGDAEVIGNSVVSNANAVKEITNVSPQETAVAPLLTVRENLEFIAKIYGFSKEEAKEKAQKLINDFALEEVASRKAKVLSGGFQRRLSIAMALVSDPKILFLDEPTLGLDVIARRELWRSIRQLKGKITIILTTHYLEEAEALSDTIGIMAKGELKAVGTAEEIVKQTGCTNFEDAFVSIVEGGLV